MKKYLLLAVCLIAVGCTKKGEKGDTGPGSTTVVYNGIVTSNDQVISVPAYGPNSLISVSVGDGIHFTECPYYAPTLGVNVTYAASQYVVELFNAAAVTATNYKIIVSNPVAASSAGYRRLLD